MIIDYQIIKKLVKINILNYVLFASFLRKPANYLKSFNKLEHVVILF
jgi:hypothetical protein